MTRQIVVPRRGHTGRTVHGIIGRCALVAIGASFGAISTISVLKKCITTVSPQSLFTTVTQVGLPRRKRPDGRLALLGADALDAALRAGFDRCFNSGQMLSVSGRRWSSDWIFPVNDRPITGHAHRPSADDRPTECAAA